MTIELLYFDGCPNHEALAGRLDELLARHGIDADVRTRRIESRADAERERFLGSPTMRVDGRDVDPTAAGRSDYALGCRLYATEQGLRGVPPDAWILEALAGRR